MPASQGPQPSQRPPSWRSIRPFLPRPCASRRSASWRATTLSAERKRGRLPNEARRRPRACDRARRLAHGSQPAADTHHVVAIRVPEAALEIGLLARDDAIAHDDRNGQHEDENPRARRGYADAGIDKE